MNHVTGFFRLLSGFLTPEAQQTGARISNRRYLRDLVSASRLGLIVATPSRNASSPYRRDGSRMRNFLVLMITVIGLGLSSAASALLIDASNWGPCLGANNCTIGGATLTSIPRGFRQKTVAGKSGLGINGGATGGEIDIDETITIDFSGANVVDEFQLLFLFNGPEFGDPQEIALITMVPVVGAPMWGTATVTGENTLTLSGFDAGATWANCGATTISGSGCFTISDPFGAMNVATIDFRAVPNTTSRGDSDYSIGFVSAVPEPATIACLGVGLAGLGFTRSRRKRG